MKQSLMQWMGWVLVGSLAIATAFGCGSKSELDQSRRAASSCVPADPNAFVFDHAVCLCGSLDKRGAGLSSSTLQGYGRGTETEGKAHVGINGDVDSSGNLKIDGDFEVGKLMSIKGNLLVKRALYVGSDLDAQGKTTVEGDAAVRGNVTTQGNLDIGGALSVGGQIIGNLPKTEAIVGATIPAHDPCACDPDKLIDVAGAVEQHASAQLVALPADLGQQELVLQAGEYYVKDAALLNGNVRIKIQGAVKLFVAADLEMIGHEVVELDEGAQLDLYLAGNVKKIGNLVIGNGKKQPASRSIRIYIGGKEPVELDLQGHTSIEGAIYAPTADIVYQGNLTVIGSLFANNLTGRGKVWVTYDSGLLGEGGSCPPPAGNDDSENSGSSADGSNGSADNGGSSTDGSGGTPDSTPDNNGAGGTTDDSNGGGGSGGVDGGVVAPTPDNNGSGGGTTPADGSGSVTDTGGGTPCDPATDDTCFSP